MRVNGMARGESAGRRVRTAAQVEWLLLREQRRARRQRRRHAREARAVLRRDQPGRRDRSGHGQDGRHPRGRCRQRRRHVGRRGGQAEGMHQLLLLLLEVRVVHGCEIVLQRLFLLLQQLDLHLQRMLLH